ncbi:PQ-loop repeat-containing protein [Candidatus Dependentiae bacterium]|nr:PQ-loop repeat-containing protein [Candidatus Dependentiae bacterium]
MIVSQFELLVLLNQIIYCYALIPLIWENWKLKTARGLSDGLMWSLLNAFIVLSFYFFCLDMPYSYRASLIIQTTFTLVIIFQRFWYDQFSYKRMLSLIYGTNFIVAVGCIPLALKWPHHVGHVAGWLGVLFLIINRIPQILKIQRERSVYGFSYWFALLLGLASVMEFVIAIAYKLPLQTVATSVWAFISFLIFTAQFYAFAWKQRSL